MGKESSAGTQQELRKEAVNCGKGPARQSDKFKDAAREHECDPDEKRWEERLRRVATAKPAKPDQPS